MPNHEREQTYMIEASGTALRWRLMVRPLMKNNPVRGACSRDVSLQVIVELLEPADDTQLDFGF